MKRTALAVAIGVASIGLSADVLAQEDNQNDTDRNNQTIQQQEIKAEEQRSDAETRDINVEQEPAEVEVKQEPPDVTVEQSEPEVTIEQPEPNVTVEEGEPDVTVEKTGEPEVTVDEADNAQVNVNQDERDEQNGQQSDQADPNQIKQDNQAEQNDQANSLMSQQVSDLEGMTVTNQEGEEIGEVQHIAKHNASGDLFAIVAVGGFWGFGATDIALSLNDMQLEDDQFVVSTAYGSNEIEDSANDYQEDEYSEVDSDMTLSEVQQQ